MSKRKPNSQHQNLHEQKNAKFTTWKFTWTKKMPNSQRENLHEKKMPNSQRQLQHRGQHWPYATTEIEETNWTNIYIYIYVYIYIYIYSIYIYIYMMLLGFWSLAVLEGRGRHVFRWWRHPLGVQTLCFSVGSFSSESLRPEVCPLEKSKRPQCTSGPSLSRQRSGAENQWQST